MALQPLFIRGWKQLSAYDYYGNPQTITCGNCGGSGQVIVYQ